MAYWLMRSEPESYGWADLVHDGETEWTGVRNYTARNFLKEMAVGDEAIFYHSGKEKACVGLMVITRAWRPDGDKADWASVAVKAQRALPHPVTLAAIRTEPKLAGLMMVRQSRLSVSKIEPEEWAVLMEMAG